MKNLDLILIDPNDQSISRVDIDGSLESMYQVMQCRVIDIMNLTDNIDLIMDDEGRLINNNRWFSWGGNTFAGKCLIASHNDDGETTSCLLEIAQIKNLEFLEEGYSEEPYMEFRPL
jgi:hypothetical protein